MLKKLIYLLEDETHIQELIQYNLEESGFEVKVFGSGEAFFQELKKQVPNLLLLDIMLPGMDGMDICRYIKQDAVYKKVPVIMLTAKSEEFDKVLGLELGADDYITKPFSLRELIARVKVALRRQADTTEKDAEVIKAGKITLDLVRHEVFAGERPVELTFKEFELLKMLLKNKGKVLSRDLLLERIWGVDCDTGTRTVDVHVRYLRQKLADGDNKPVYIETVRGIGYRFSDKKER